MRRVLQLTATILALCVVTCAVAGSGTDSAARKEPSSEVLVEVNGDDVTRRELDRFAAFLSASAQAGALTGAQQEQLEQRSRQEALRRLIERRLLVQAAREEFFGEQNAEEALSQFGKRQMEDLQDRLGSPIALRQFLSSQDLSREEFMRLRRNTILIREYLRRKVEKSVYVPPWRIKQYYREHQDEFQHPQTVVFRQLWVNAGGSEGRKQAGQILRRIKSGASFAEMADEYGSSSSRHPGGLHTVKGKGKLRGWLKEVLKGLEPGEVSDVKETPIGYCIVKLEKWQEPGLQPFSEVADQIRRQLRTQMEREKRQQIIQRLRQEATIRYRSAARSLLKQGASAGN